jgi:hypothetical protein
VEATCFSSIPLDVLSHPDKKKGMDGLHGPVVPFFSTSFAFHHHIL